METSTPTSQPTPTSLVSVGSCFFHTQQEKERKEERRSGLSEASHYYGNIAHTAPALHRRWLPWLYRNCAGAKELLQKQQRGIRRTQLSLCETPPVLAVDAQAVFEEVGLSIWPDSDDVRLTRANCTHNFSSCKYIELGISHIVMVNLSAIYILSG